MYRKSINCSDINNLTAEIFLSNYIIKKSSPFLDKTYFYAVMIPVLNEADRYCFLSREAEETLEIRLQIR